MIQSPAPPLPLDAAPRGAAEGPPAASPPEPKTRASTMRKARVGGGSGSAEPDPPLHLKPEAVAGAVGLGHEVTLLRAAIRHLVEEEHAAAHVKTLAELRHQVEALCRALKTQHALDGRGDDLSADLARALAELDDELGDESDTEDELAGVPR